MNSVFLFAPDGLIRCCAIDAPESMHESSLADFGAHQQISNVHNTHQTKVAVDSTFNLSGSLRLVESSQIDPVKNSS